MLIERFRELTHEALEMIEESEALDCPGEEYFDQLKQRLEYLLRDAGE